MLVIETDQLVSTNKAGTQHSASMYVQCVVNTIVGDGSWTRQEEQERREMKSGLKTNQSSERYSARTLDPRAGGFTAHILSRAHFPAN